MNSIEIAEKLLKANHDDILTYREYEKTTRSRILKLEVEVRDLERDLEKKRQQLKSEYEYMTQILDEKKEYLVDALALKKFIADGGGLDMLDD